MAFHRNHAIAAAVVIILVILYAFWPSPKGTTPAEPSPTPSPSAKPAGPEKDCAALSGMIPVPFKDMDKQADNRKRCYLATNCTYDDMDAKCFEDSNAKSIPDVKHNCYVSESDDCSLYDHCKLVDNVCQPV